MAIDVVHMPRLRLPFRFGPLRRRRERAAADRWLAERTHAFVPNETVRARIAELTSPRERTLLANSLLGAVRDAKRIGLSASPLNRRAISECAVELTEVAQRLDDLSRPVAPRGVVLVRRMLTDGSSPMYGHARREDLELEVGRIRAALDVFKPADTANSRQQGPQIDGSRGDTDARVGDPRSTGQEER